MRRGLCILGVLIVGVRSLRILGAILRSCCVRRSALLLILLLISLARLPISHAVSWILVLVSRQLPLRGRLLILAIVARELVLTVTRHLTLLRAPLVLAIARELVLTVARHLALLIAIVARLSALSHNHR